MRKDNKSAEALGGEDALRPSDMLAMVNVGLVGSTIGANALGAVVGMR